MEKVIDLDLDAKLYADAAYVTEDKAIFYVRVDGNNISYCYGGDHCALANAILTVLRNDENNTIYEAVDAALEIYDSDKNG